MACIPPELAATLDSIDAALSAVENALDPLLTVNLQSISAKLEPLDNARLLTSYATTAASLMYCEWCPLNNYPSCVFAGYGMPTPFCEFAGYDDETFRSTGL